MDDKLTEEDWGKLQNALHGRDSKWQAIGIQLNVSHGELTEIRERCGENLEACNREMQIVWLKSGKATWRALLEALQSASVGLLEDAKRIRENYFACTKLDSDPSCNAASRLAAPATKVAPTITAPENQLPVSLLIEHLEWLLKIGYKVEDIVQWTLAKKQLQPSGVRANALGEGDQASESSGGASAQGQEDNYQRSIQSSTPNNHPPTSADTSMPIRRSNRKKAPSRKLNLTLTRKRSGCAGPSKQPRPKRARSTAVSDSPASNSPASNSPETSIDQDDDFSQSPSQLQPNIEETDHKTSKTFKKNLLQVLESIRTHPDAEEFLQPVDGTRAPDYYDVIEKPMCLWTMKSNVYKGVYKTVGKFCDDFDLIVDNCEEFNGEESEYTQQVRRLRVVFYDLIKARFDTNNTGGSSPSCKAAKAVTPKRVQGQRTREKNMAAADRIVPTPTKFNGNALSFQSQNGNIFGHPPWRKSNAIAKVEPNPVDLKLVMTDRSSGKDKGQEDSDVDSNDSDDELPSFSNLFTS